MSRFCGVRCIAELYVIEADIGGKPPDQCLLARRAKSRPLLDKFELWLHATMAKLKRETEHASRSSHAAAESVGT